MRLRAFGSRAGHQSRAGTSPPCDSSGGPRWLTTTFVTPAAAVRPHAQFAADRAARRPFLPNTLGSGSAWAGRYPRARSPRRAGFSTIRAKGGGWRVRAQTHSTRTDQAQRPENHSGRTGPAQHLARFEDEPSGLGSAPGGEAAAAFGPNQPRPNQGEYCGAALLQAYCRSRGRHRAFQNSNPESSILL